MNDETEFDDKLNAKRWVSYLDLLGFTELTNAQDPFSVFLYYTKAIEEFSSKRGFRPDMIEKTWFSDTFLLYTTDDSAYSWAIIDSITRWFIFFLIYDNVVKPIRGALSCDNFYADKDNNIFFGKALIEAYTYGENQDWIGFILSPSAIKQMKQVGLPANERFNYAYWDIPYKRHDLNIEKHLPAYIIGTHASDIDGQNPCLEKLKQHKRFQKDANIVRKYENTIKFLEANKRWMVDKTNGGSD
jgi:hypothetical protein